jgi:electron transfer flavoprotein beta subunit
MKILVCISVVPDTTTRIKLKEDKKSIDENGIQWIINPWDELALTRAIELKEGSQGKIKSVTVIHAGDKASEQVLRKALAIGADNAIRLDFNPQDSFQAAKALAAVINKEDYGLIMAGIESSDYNSSMVGGMLAELLDMPSISSVSNIDLDDNFVFTSEIDGGSIKISFETPVVAIVQKGIAQEPRIPNMRGIMMARRKPLKVENATENKQNSALESLEMPAPKAACEIIEADNPKKLIDYLQTKEKIL